MKNIGIIISLFLFCLASLSAINSYTIMEIGKIEIGNEKEKLSYKPVKPPNIISTVPTAFTINPDTKLLYVLDPIKKRIAIFDLNLKYQNEIKGKGFNLKQVNEIKFGESNNIYLLTGDHLFHTNDNGDLNYYFKYKNTYESIKSKGYYPIGGNVYFYDKTDNIIMINDAGEVLSDAENKKKLKSFYDNHMNNTRSFNFLTKQDYTYFMANNILIKENKILTTNKYKAKIQYYDYVKEKVNKEIRKDLKAKGIITENKFIPDFDVYDTMENFIGYDSTDNAYWNGWVDGKRVVIVLNILGEAIDCFEIDKKFKQQIVAPNGDVYMWEIQPEGVTFYKIPNNW